jgi:hypothetical protein
MPEINPCQESMTSSCDRAEDDVVVVVEIKE